MRHRALVVLLLAIIVIVVAGVSWRTQSHMVMAGIQDKLVDELGKTINGQVTVGHIEVSSLKTLTLYNAEVHDRQGNRIGVSEKIIVAVSLLDLIRGHVGVDAITNISVYNPQLNLVEHAGQWNVQTLLSKEQQQATAFHGKVTLIDGSALVSSQQGQWPLEQVNGMLDFAEWPTIVIHISAAHKGGAIVADGNINTTGRGVIRVKADQIDVADMAGLVPADNSLQLLAGKARDVVITLERSSKGSNYAGEANLSGIAADIDGVPVREAGGLITFTPDNLYLYQNTAKVHGQPVAVRGRVSLNTSEPVLDLTVSSAGFDPAVLGYGQVQGAVLFDAQVSGTATNPSISGKFTLPQGQIVGYAASDATAKLTLANKVVTVEQAEASLFSGKIAGSGTVRLDTLEYNLHVKGNGLDLASVGSPLPAITGRADCDVFLSGTGALSAAAINATATIRDGQAGGIPFNQVSAGISQSPEGLVVDFLNARLGEGSITASGTIQHEQLALTVRGQKLPLAVLAERFPELKLSGTTDFTGQVSGTTASPLFLADFTAVGGQAFYQPFESITGSMQVTPELVKLENVQAKNGITSHILNGSIGLTGAQSVNVTIITRQARAENIIELLAPGEKLTGNVDNDLMITGSLKDFTATGKMTLTEGSYRGQLIAKMTGSYRRAQGITRIENVLINSLNTEISLSGTITDQNELDLAIAAHDIDMARINYGLPYPITGRASFSGTLTGQPQVPVFHGELSAAKLSLNGCDIETVVGTVNVNGNQIEIPRFSFSQGTGKFAFAGGVDIGSQWLNGSLDVSDADLGGLLTMLRLPDKDITGKLDGHIALSGSASRPSIALTGKVRSGTIKKYPLDNVDMDVELDNNIITVKTFTANQGAGVLAIQGTADLDGPLNLEVGGRDIDAGLLTAWSDTTLAAKGKLNFGAQVSGTAAHPHTAMSLEISGGSVANATFDSLYGLFILENRSIHVNQLLLSKGPYRASAYGVIPLAAFTSKGRQSATLADQMNLKLRLDQADLSILPMLTKEVSWATGETKGEVTIGGTVAEPTINGQLLIQNGTVKMASLADPIQKVAVDIQFKGDKIDINAFDGYMGGGSYRLTGSTRLQGLDFTDYNLMLTLDKLKVNHKYFRGPLNGSLTLAHNGRRPVLSGKLLFENTTIDIPLVPEMGESELNLGLDLEIIAGKKVRLYNSYMYDITAEGRAKFSGSMKKPITSGRFEVVRGTVSYLRTPFKIKEGRADFTQFDSLLPVIKLDAETRLEHTTVKLELDGPVTSMEMRLTSEPNMNQQEILSLLTLRSRYFDKQKQGGAGHDEGLGRDELVGLLDAGLQMRFVAEMEDAFRRAFGLDEFRVVRGTLSDDSDRTDNKSERELFTDREVYNIEISKNVTDKLMLNYTFGVGHNEWAIGFRYDLTRRISVTGSSDEENRRRVGLETRFRF